MSVTRIFRKLRRVFTHSELSFYAYRYRYLTTFAVIGLASILVELLATQLMPVAWPWLPKASLAFVIGLAVSFWLNATLNFRVRRSHMLRTFKRFAAVSIVSFGLNMLVVSSWQELAPGTYGWARLLSSGALFLVAYALHRKYTFDSMRNLGVAVYAAADERVYPAYYRVGRKCDHIHVDLIDETMNPRCAPVDLNRLTLARKLWKGTPLCLHVMSTTPRKWLEAARHEADWMLFHLGCDDDPLELVMLCHEWKKKVGVVWHGETPLVSLLPLLPHLDFVMVLGIAQPGKSGQPLSDRAVEVASLLDRLRTKYSYQVMFDGGVNPATIHRIHARYVVAASAVLKAADPILSVHNLKTGGRYERRAA
jgi:pentose-5-phosphate-3-epimerase/putative flippase GtrA